MKSARLALAALLVLSSPLAAQTFEVPGDYSDLQTALDSVPADATIVVHGGHWFGLEVTQPVRLVGDPMPYIWGGGETVLDPPITLGGPGSGDVVLSNVNVGMLINANAFVMNAPAIRGGGFDGLFVYDSQVSGPEWEFVYNYVFPGATGIETTVPLVWVERSFISGSATAASPVNTHHPSSNPTPLGAPGGSGIVAPQTVVVIDSTVRAGSGDFIYYASPDCNFPCPGGDGVVCRMLIHARSTITGGGPSRWFDEAGIDVCCSGVRGRRIIAENELTLRPDPPAPPLGGGAVWPPTPGTLLGSLALTAPPGARIGRRVQRWISGAR